MQLKNLVAALLLLLLIPQLSVLSAQKKEGCRRCEHRGMLQCKAHSEEIHAFEKEVLFCATIAACDRCGGTLMEDCEHCEDGPDIAIAAARRVLIEAWLPPNRLETHLKRSLPRIETESFHLVVNTGDLKEGRKRVEEHLIAHTVAHDVELAAKSMDAHFTLERKDYQSKMRMWIWNNPDDHSAAMTQFLDTGASGDFKMLGRAPVFSVWTEPGLFNTVRSVRTLFTHNATHMLLSNALFPLWVGDLGGGWLDAGVGHYYEYEIYKDTRNYCIEESTSTGQFANGVWRTAVRKHLNKVEEPALPRLFLMNTGAMEQYQQALCWSFFEYLVHNHQPALREILADLKAKKKTRVIMRERLGMDIFGAENAWRAWVEASYPKRGDELRLPPKEK